MRRGLELCCLVTLAALAGCPDSEPDPPRPWDAGNTDVAHTAVIDYVFDTKHPIDPEDGNASPLVVSVVGNGSVIRDPDKVAYTIGESVELTAVPVVDSVFVSWTPKPAAWGQKPRCARRGISRYTTRRVGVVTAQPFGARNPPVSSCKGPIVREVIVTPAVGAVRFLFDEALPFPQVSVQTMVDFSPHDDEIPAK